MSLTSNADAGDGDGTVSGKDLDNHSSNTTVGVKERDGEELKRRMEEAEALILKWEVEDALPWDESEDVAFQYLAAVDDVLAVMEAAEGDAEVLAKAESLLQSAMAKLEDEFKLVLISNNVPLDAERLHGSIRKDDPDSNSGYFNEKAVYHLREIAKRMIKSGYEKECCQVYTSERKSVMDKSLTIIGPEKMSNDDVQKMLWKNLDDKINKWALAMKMVVKVLLCEEKKLCAKIFNESELIVGTCLTEISKGCVMQLLNFGGAVAIAKRSSEKLFQLLNMYDALSNVIPELEELFSDESRKIVCLEAAHLLKTLGEAAMGILCDFEEQVQGETLKMPDQGGEIHPFTIYVMNYVKLLVDYRNTLNQLLEVYDVELPNKNDQSDGVDKEDMSPIGRRLLLLTSYLEKNLKETSMLYKDKNLGFIFLMNNIRYMVLKVMDSELRNVLGDNWIRSRKGHTKMHATNYFRGCWNAATAFLRVTDIGSGSSNNALKAVKERFKGFNTCFEDIYRTQTGWKIQDPELRKDVQAMTSGNVILAYRSFFGWGSRQLLESRHPEKYIKYSIEDLEDFLPHLFEGVPRDLTQQSSTKGIIL